MMILRYSYELEWLIWGVIYDNNMSDIGYIIIIVSD
jgi:hypothetical protein